MRHLRPVVSYQWFGGANYMLRSQHPIVTSEEINKYKTDSATLAKWLDVSIVKQNGRCFDADRILIKKQHANMFPNIKAHTLSGKDITVPTGITGSGVKLLVFSFKHYGFTLVRSWLDPFIECFANNHQSRLSYSSETGFSGATAAKIDNTPSSKPRGGKYTRKAVASIQHSSNSKPDSISDVNSYNSKNISSRSSSDSATGSNASNGQPQQDLLPSVVAFELCFVEYGFLSMAKSLFANNIKANINPSQVENTALVFGGVKVIFTAHVCYQSCIIHTI